jgi:twinkle protein
MLLDGKDSEKEQIERMMLTLKKLTQELNIWIGLIAHLKKSAGGATFEEGAIATLDDLKGSSAIKQLSNGVYVMSRDQQAEDLLTRNTTQITVKKCRFTGRTGLADRLVFSDETGRMTKLKDDDIPF